MLSRAGERTREDVPQGFLVLDREAAQDLGRFAHPAAHLIAQFLPVAGQHDVLDTPVLVVGTTLNEPPLLEPVDDARHVRAVAAQQGRQLAHRERSTRLHLQQRALLRRMQTQFGRDVEEALALGTRRRYSSAQASSAGEPAVTCSSIAPTRYMMYSTVDATKDRCTLTTVPDGEAIVANGLVASSVAARR